MAFTDLNKAELLQAADFYKVETDLNPTKANLANALLDAGKTPEQWEEDKQANDFGLDPVEQNQTLPEPQDVEPEVEEEEESEPEVEEKNEDELVLVRFVGGNASYSTGRFSFSRNKPFALMKNSQFEALPRQKFRLANKAEAAEFYRK